MVDFFEVRERYKGCALRSVGQRAEGASASGNEEEVRKDLGNLWLIDRQGLERFWEGSVSRVRGVCAGAPLHSSNPAGGGKQRAKRRTRG